MQYFVWILLSLLVILHQWRPLRAESELVAGVLPIGLLYHAAISLAAAFVWWLATLFAWPLNRETEPPRSDEVTR